MFIANAYTFSGDIKTALEYYRKAVSLDSTNKENLLVYLEIANEFIERKQNGKL